MFYIIMHWKAAVQEENIWSRTRAWKQVSSSSVLRGEKVWPLTPRSLQQLSEMVVGWCVVMWGGYLSARRTNAAMNICYRRNKHQGNWNYGPTTQVSMNPTDPVVFRGKKHSTDDCRVWGISTSSTQCITGKIRFSSLILSGLIVFWQAQSKYWTQIREAHFTFSIFVEQSSLHL